MVLGLPDLSGTYDSANILLLHYTNCHQGAHIKSADNALSPYHERKTSLVSRRGRIVILPKKVTE